MVAKPGSIQSFSVHEHIPCYVADPVIHFLSNHQKEFITSVKQGLSCCKLCGLGKRSA